MTRRAKKPTTGNRFTTTNMRARQAQTIVGCIAKISKVSEADNIPSSVRTRLENALVELIIAVRLGDREEELPSSLRR